MYTIIKKSRHIIILVLLGALFFVLGISYGESRTNGSFRLPANIDIVNNTVDVASNAEVVDMEPFWTVWKILDDKYVATMKNSATSSSQDRIWGAIKGMTDSLNDPYTTFMPPEDSKEFDDNISGNFEGVGMEIGIKDDVLTVIAPLKGSPAEIAGIRAGDKIIAIDDKSSSDLSTVQAVKLIRGTKGTTVKIAVLRTGHNKALSFDIVRAVINIPTVDTEIKGDVFVISLYNFYANSRALFNEALQEFINSKKHKLILDLRGNPGGYLNTAVDMASWFLPLGKPIVREDFGGDKAENVYRSKGYNIFNDNLEMIILVDGGSASASEILAGALQEYEIAKLVGTKTYGKGSVQELVSVTKDTSLKVTVAKWLTPSGKSISEGGLLPDYEIKITEDNIKTKDDPQMEKALELLK